MKEMHLIERAILDAYDGWTEISNGGRNRLIRCPECGDSIKSDHGHLSITRSYPFLYKCFRCNWSGAVDADFLSCLGVEITPEIKEALRENHKAVVESAKEQNLQKEKSITNFLRGKQRKFFVPEVKEENMDNQCLQYLNDRFKTEFTKEELDKFRVIADLREFWILNHIDWWPREKEELTTLANWYLSFSSSDGNEFISRRTFDDEEDELLGRYLETKLNKNAERLYCFKDSLDLCETHLKLVIGEGIFDLIGVWNKFPKYREGYVFAACLGKSLESVLDFFVSLGFLHIEVNFFADNDVTDDTIRKWWREMEYPSILGFRLSIYRNKMGKDFGVPASEIRLA